jgi:hypothetical protein
VHITNNVSKDFTVAVKNTCSGHMNEAILNDKSAVSLITVLYTLR